MNNDMKGARIAVDMNNLGSPFAGGLVEAMQAKLQPTAAHRQGQLDAYALELACICSGVMNAAHDQATAAERKLRAGITHLIERMREDDFKEEHIDAVSFHLFRKLDEMSSAIDTMSEKALAITDVKLHAVISRLTDEEPK